MKKIKKALIIGEIGINHNGSLTLAKKIILLAKESGFDYVKFQKRNPDISTPINKKNVLRDTPWGRISYLDYKKKIEFNEKQYKELNKYCKKINIKWFASAWDLESLKFLRQFNLRYNKVASPMLTNLKLLKAIAKEKKHTLISTGMSTFNNIDRAIKIFKTQKCKFTLLHCVSTYPADLEDLNLKMIQVLKKKYTCTIGYSGHEKSVSPSVFARILGAEIIERHITSDRTIWGTDQAASLEPQGMKSLVEMIRKYEFALGDGKKKFLKKEKSKLEDMKYW
jgi:N-acetylneuraminate synthase